MNKEMREKTHERCTCDEKVVERMEGGGGGGKKEGKREERNFVDRNALLAREGFILRGRCYKKKQIFPCASSPH